MTAVCPFGTVPTGGGGRLNSSSTARGYVALDRLEPTNTGFIAGMREAVPYAGNWTVTAEAVCAPEPLGRVVVSATGALGQLGVTVGCGFKSVIGMGGRVNNGFGDVLLDQITPTSDLKFVTVRAAVVPGGNATNSTVTAFAVCAYPPAGLELVGASAVAASDSSSAKTAAKDCPAGKALYSAAVATFNGAGQVFLSSVQVKPTDRVTAQADEITTGYAGNWNLTAFGICAS